MNLKKKWEHTSAICDATELNYRVLPRQRLVCSNNIGDANITAN